jgi:hypothetical protein
VPDLLFTAAELGNLRRRATIPAFRPAVERLRGDVARADAMHLRVPERPGGYYHDFTCPDHGVELRFDPARPGEHRCPVDGARFSGERFDAAWRWFVNHHLAESTLRRAALWRTEGDDAQRAAVRDVLLGYADRYAFYATCPRPGANPGVATYTTLDESVWLIPLAWAHALVADSLPAAEAAAIVDRLLVPAAEHLVRRRYDAIHNFTCWHNAAIATVGRIAGRADLLAFALEGRIGQRAQLREGMLPDGLWFEGSMSYHFYSVWALLLSTLAFRHDPRTSLLGDPALPRSLLTPLACAHPDGTLPATNDCWYFTSVLGACCHGVPPAPDFYELAQPLFGDPALAAPLHAAYTSCPRDSLYALMFGPETLPAATPSPRRSVGLRSSGLAILRPTERLDVLLKSGPHGGHHGHPDKLGLSGWYDGWRFSPDLGTPGYGVASLETWYRQSLSHSTLLIDGESQPPVDGRIEHCADDQASATVAWEGVRMRRVLHARPEYFIDVCEIACTALRRIDWIYHNAGRLDAAQPPGRPAGRPPGGIAYAHLGDIAEHAGEGPGRWRWRDGDYEMLAWTPAVRGEMSLSGTGPSNPPTDRLGFLLRRREAERAIFLTVFHPFRTTPHVESVEFTDDGGVSVRLANRCDDWTPGQLAGPV